MFAPRACACESSSRTSDRRSLGDHESVAASVERARCCRRIVVSDRQSAHRAEAGEPDRRDRRLGAAAEHDVGAAEPDANCLLSVMDHCLRSRHYVNVVVAGKHPAPQWLTMDAAVKHCAEGIGIWPWASNDQDLAPDVVMACCGDVPTLETLAAVSIMREHLPDLRIRVVNVVDLMKLQPQTEHPHGLSDVDFDDLFTKDKPVIFAFHAYPWLIHRLTYRRTNHDNIHVRGYKEEGTITTPFDMTVLNDLDRFHLVIDTIDRLPQTGDKGVYLKQWLKDKLIEHKQYIDKYGDDLPEIRNWKWSNPK